MEDINDKKEKIKQIKLIDLKTPILKLIFSFINEKKKLNIIINNKRIQKKLEINIINYVKISGIYKIGERNGRGKEYDKYNKHKLKFEGEYLNGKRNGKGKEYYYYDSKLVFEGEYLNGERNGKGKEYYYNGELKFEGEYLNGERWNGKWKSREYYINDKLEFKIKNI